MAFQIKDFASITAAMINHARATTKKITDWIPGSVARTIIEAPAVEIEELYLQMFTGIREAIPVALYESFDFTPLAMAFAHGYVYVVNLTPAIDDLPIPIDTPFETSDGRRYLSTSLVTWETGETEVRIPVIADVAGATYNVAVGAISSSPFFDSTYTISNSAIDNGRDVESDSEREARFTQFILSLSQGTIAACRYAVTQSFIYDEDGNIVEYVTRTGINERPGYVRIYIYTSIGLPSPEILAAANLAINGSPSVIGVRAAGIRVSVLAMIERSVDISINVKMLTGYNLDAGTISKLEQEADLLLNKTLSGETLYLDAIAAGLLSVTGIKELVVVGTENIIALKNEYLKLGTLTIGEL